MQIADALEKYQITSSKKRWAFNLFYVSELSAYSS